MDFHRLDIPLGWKCTGNGNFRQWNHRFQKGNIHSKLQSIQMKSNGNPACFCRFPNILVLMILLRCQVNNPKNKTNFYLGFCLE